jgi:hypothetical protein
MCDRYSNRTQCAQKVEIRSTKSEIRNNIKIQIFKIQNQYPSRRFFLFWALIFWSFEFVSNFDIRISDLFIREF